MNTLKGLYNYRITGGEPFEISSRVDNTDGIDYLTVTMHTGADTVPS